MHRLDIVIGSSIIEKRYKLFELIPWDVIKQHRIILSGTIIADYLTVIDDPSAQMALKNFISSIITNNQQCNMCQDYVSDDPKLDMIKRLVDVPFHTLIAELSEFSNYEEQLRKAHITITTLADIRSGSFEVPINRLSVPYKVVARIGDDCNVYIEWLKHLLESEKQLKIVDPYLMSEYNCNAFIDDLLPCIPSGAVVDFYYAMDKAKSMDKKRDYSDTAEELIKKAAGTTFVPVFHSCDGFDMHDRYILVSSFEIVITNGLSALKRNATFRKECDVYTSNTNMHTVPLTKLEKLLANQQSQ